MEFLETIESIKAEAASTQRLFGGEGRSVRAGRRDNPQYDAMFTEALDLIARAFDGNRMAALQLEEAMTTDDFPQLFGDVLDRQLLAGYRETPTTFRNYLRVAQVRDFRTVKRFKVDGGEGQLDKVAERTRYPEGDVADGEYSYTVDKYGRRMDFSWESMINDDLEALRDMPARLGRAARRTEERFATGLFVGASGPNSTFFAAGNANIITANPVLSILALQTAMTILSAQVDADGEPIFIEGMHLVVPPALEVVAENILNGLQLELTAAGGTADQKLITANWMKNRLKLHVNYYIPAIATSNDNTTWFIFADPAGGRPAAEVGFLRGHTEPEVFQKIPDSVRVGGGTAGALEGDFEHDAVAHKVRHVIGGTLMDPKMAVASNGSGS